MINITKTAIILQNGHELVQIAAWGKGLRITAVPYGKIPADDPECCVLEPGETGKVIVTEPADHPEGYWSIENCGIRCEIRGTRLLFYSGDRLLLEEESYDRPLASSARQYKPHMGDDGFETIVRFKSNNGEILHGMGQYRTGRYNLKGCSLELAHRNSQISIPFVISNRGYGFFWNNPAVGNALFAENVTEWTAKSIKKLDYWICAADTPAEIIARYTELTGRASALPEDLLGLWQCKLRYRTQDELLTVAREYRRRGIRLDVIVIDFFHWIQQGDWSFDPEYWPDPQAMVDELTAMGTKLMVSVWPTVDPRSVNYQDFRQNGYLVSADRGLQNMIDCFGMEGFYDATNPDARKYAYNLLRKNYGQYGIQMYWLDEAEPEYSHYDYDFYRYHIGPVQQIGNLYPRMLTQMAYEGLQEDGVKEPISLVRCAWVGSPKYGALVWSGDIDSTFDEMKRQIWNGINMGTAGIPYWISDIGGFNGGNVNDPVFRELLVRWYQWAVFTPVLRMHGNRQPSLGSLDTTSNKGGGIMPSGAANELWSFGEEVYEILLQYLKLREDMIPYIKALADESGRNGMPMIRGMYFMFPEDAEAWKVDDQYMFGETYLVAPVTEYGARQRKVYLPAGKWEAMDGSGIIESCGEYVTADAPLEYMPVYKRI